MASISNIYIDQGADYSVTITVENRDLTGHTVTAQLRKSYGSSVAYDLTGEVTASAPEQSQITLTLLGEDSADIPAGRYLYDVKDVSVGGSPTRIVEGIAVVTPQITRAA